MKINTHKHTMHLRTGDWDYIESIFKPHGIATSVVIRTLVSNYVDAKKRQEEKDEPVNVQFDL